MSETYGIDTRDALLHPWEKDAWKNHCKSLVTSYWQRQLLSEYHERSTLHFLEVNSSDLAHPHGIFYASRMDPFLSPATATRARAMVGRLNLSFMPWKQDTVCPLCESEKESIEHFTARCRALAHIRNQMTEQLTNMYTSEGKPPPESDHETTSALINGDRYVSDRHRETIHINDNNCNCQNL